MTAICGPRPSFLHMTKQVTLTHQPQHFLMIAFYSFTPELCCHPAISISHHFDADGLYPVHNVCAFFVFLGIAYSLVIIAAPGKAHKLASPGDSFEFVPLDDLPFLPWRVTLFCKPLFN